ncbi:hypothetical protein [Sedimenticola hydrogenitrophicus]|uniref:hypothetical protein n=1 Tax=Sedimenticola hydrogenitrophicus TaxID=2967975 RepID=UPI0023AF9798|nr:hypothetical protein [Sedimenticola hydrogenitrophicus]
MPIYRKETITPHLRELDEYYQNLRSILGAAPNTNIADRFHLTPDQMSKECVQVNLDDLAKAVKHFKVVVEDLGRLKNKEYQLKPMRQGD